MTSSWYLEDCEARHAEAPDTFDLLKLEIRRRMRTGNLVKLIFNLHDPKGNMTGERMWVKVVEATHIGDDTTYVGQLDNTPAFIDDLAPGDPVMFEPKHIATLWVDH